MFAICPIRRSIRTRIAVLAVAGVAALSVLSGVAQASSSSSFYFGNTLGGTVSLTVACDHYGHAGAAGVDILLPATMANGLWVETRLYVKARSQAWQSAVSLGTSYLLARGKKTIVSPDLSIWDGTATLISTRTFTGSSFGYYDVGVNYRVAQPGGTWSAWFWLAATSVRENVSQYASYFDATQCML